MHVQQTLRITAIVLAGMLLASCASEMQRAENKALEQQLDTPVTVQVSTPPFDEAYAKAALAKGSSTIKGVVFHKIANGGKEAGRDAGLLNFARGTPMPNVKVFLYPATEHAKELIRLENENRSARAWRKVQLKSFAGDPRVSSYRLMATSDANGLFEFTEMRPGNYLLVTDNWDINSNGQETVPVGHSYQTAGYVVNRYGATEIPKMVIHTEDRHFRVRTEVSFNDVINVPANNTVVKVEARMRPAR
ncbi:MAG: hypothetical protein WAV95_20355 [Azonexus sp.]